MRIYRFAGLVFGLGLIAGAGSSAAWGDEAADKPKVELRWVERKQMEGVTEEEGFQMSCDPDDIVYPHKKPALVLTRAEVAEAVLKKLDLTKNGLGFQYMVTFRLTKEAREKLAATVEGNQMRLLTVVVDGKCWGVRRYEKDAAKKFVPEPARAESFQPDVGYFSSEAAAQRLVNAFK
ncbi:MAG TPA: hypothetical protein VNC50_19610 [Planctomycetia bacterium]|nr:hypothetical protein [Planctomycetia bacterium]